MKKYFFLLFILIVGFVGSDVQKESIVLRWIDQKESENGKPVLSELIFLEAEFPNHESRVPYFHRVYNLNDKNQDFVFSIENTVFEEIILDPDFPGYNMIGNEIQIVSQKFQSNGTFMLHVQMPTVIKDGDKILRLKEFELKKVPANASLNLKSVQNDQAEHIWKTSSVLKQGKWIKIGVTGKGVFKIPYSKLLSLGFSDPAKVNVFGSGGTILSEDPGIINYDDLEQCAVWHDKNNGTDCLFIYSPGTTEWSLDQSKGIYRHKINDYSTKGYFFLTDNVGSAKIAERLPKVEESVTHTVLSADAYLLYENDFENVLPLGSGKQWYGEKFKHSSLKNLDFNLIDIETSEQIKIRINAIARSYAQSELKLQVNQSEIGILNFNQVSTSSQTLSYANEQEGIFSSNSPGNQLKVTLKYFGSNANGSVDDNAICWLDYMEINYRRKLKFGNDALFFKDKSTLGAGNVVLYSLENASLGSRIFDVSKVNEVKELTVEITGNTAKTITKADKLSEYLAFNPNGNYNEPEYLGEVENQNIHGLSTPEFIIITHSNFIASANELADFHRTYDAMSVEVVTADQVYNEFSSGTKSATGIRNFIKMLYDRGENLKYVLLFGDGSYDNRSLLPNTKSFIPTFQSENSLVPVASFVTDDYFVMLDAGEHVYTGGGAVDLGIGRIPASTIFEAELVVNKIKNYYKPEALGNWRNVVCLIGDDEDSNLHMSQSEQLANQIKDSHGEFITDKIYFDAYLQTVTAGEEKYPDVTDAINNRVKDGVLILNYVGHANERYMADEHVLDISNVNSWSNANNLPIFVTATCEFSRYDADDMSIGEYVLFNPVGGGIGLFSTTRLVYASENFKLSTQFYNFVFETDNLGNRYRMGDIMRLAKINTGTGINKRNFSLLADPALRLSYPKHKVITTSINGRDTENFSDTINALEKVDISGYISDHSGNMLSNFSGEMAVTVYDKESSVSTMGNNGERPFNYKVQENIIYQGQATVENGEFSFSFVVPKDISYAIGQGKIMYYAKNADVDAHGAFDDFKLGGLSDKIVEDSRGPEIDLFMDSRDFISGDKTSKNPTMLAYLTDENGINTAGTGIGHDITAVLDDDYSNVMVLNNYYRADINSFTSGIVSFPFKNLAPGKHKLKLKAWDVANNSSEKEIEFEVTGDFYISQVLNTPNPASDYTFFTFEHNQSDEKLNVMIEIFDQMGRRVEYIISEVGSGGTKSNPIRWNFNESKTLLLNGIYIYRITAQNRDGLYYSKSGKMLIAR